MKNGSLLTGVGQVSRWEWQVNKRITPKCSFDEPHFQQRQLWRHSASLAVNSGPFKSLLLQKNNLGAGATDNDGGFREREREIVREIMRAFQFYLFFIFSLSLSLTLCARVARVSTASTPFHDATVGFFSYCIVPARMGVHK